MTDSNSGLTGFEPWDKAPETPPTVPDHTLIRRIGTGSYGEVWLARNMMGSFRAVKVVYRGRFEEERPYQRELEGIRRYEPISRTYEGFIDVLHVGVNVHEGYFYYVMELGDDASGETSMDPRRYRPKILSQTIREKGRLPVEECITVALSLSAALRHLHERGLVHRDIKPSNIIFIDRVPKLADIGLVTGIGKKEAKSFVGTEGFIPPEGPGTERADLYGLGKVLYEMATGQDRNAFPDFPAGWEQWPEKERFLELNEVVTKACEPDLKDRYATAKDMHADLTVLDNGKSVRRLHQLEYRWGLARRWGVTLTAAAVIVSGAIWYVNLEFERRAQERQRMAGGQVAHGSRAINENQYFSALMRYAEALRWDEGNARQEAAHRYRFGTILDQTARITDLWTVPSKVQDLGVSPDGRYAVVREDAGPVTVWELTGEGTMGPAKAVLMEHATSAQFSRDGMWVGVSSSNRFHLFRTTTWTEEATLDCGFRSLAMDFHPDGRFVAASLVKGEVTLLTVPGLAVVTNLTVAQRTGMVRGLSYNRDGSLLVASGEDGRAYVWNTSDYSLAREEPFRDSSWIYKATFSPDSRYLVTAGFSRLARVWDLATGQEKLPPLRHGDGVVEAEFTPDGRYIVTGCFDGTVRLWDAATHLPASQMAVLTHSHRIARARVFQDGRRIVAGAADGTLRVWDLAGARPSFEHYAGSMAEDGDRYLTFDEAGQRWEVHETTNWTRLLTLPAGPPGGMGGKLFSGGRLAAVSAPGAQEPRVLWMIELEEKKATWSVAPNWPFNAAETILSTSGRWLAGMRDDRVAISERSTGRESMRESQLKPPLSIAFQPHADRLAVGTGRGVFIYDLATGKPERRWVEMPDPVSYVTFTKDGRYLVVCLSDYSTRNQFARVWDVEAGKVVSPNLYHRDGVTHATPHPDGQHLLTSGEDNMSHYWNWRTGRRLPPSLVHGADIFRSAISPSGSWVLTMDMELQWRLWDLESREPISPFIQLPIVANECRFAPDERSLIAYNSVKQFVRLPFRIDPRPWRDLERHAWLLSGGWEAEGNEATNMDREKVHNTYRELRLKYPEYFRVSAEEILRWHLAEAHHSERLQRWAGASHHLELLSRMKPEDGGITARLTRARELAARAPAPSP